MSPAAPVLDRWYRHAMSDPQREIAWLRRVRDFSHELAQARDVKALVARILEAAVELTGAQRGLLVRLKQPGRSLDVRVEAARGFEAAELRAGPRLSRTVVQRVLERDERGLVTTSEEDAALTRATSLQGQGVTCVICVPMRLRGVTQGVLYLDHRADPDAFREGDLPALRTFADVAALALEEVERSAGQRAPALPGLSRFGELVGASPGMRAVYQAIDRCARSWEPVLITGETGTGKRLVAGEIHRRGSFPDAPCLEVSCAGPAGDVEEALFGPASALLRAGQGTVILSRLDALAGPLQLRLLAALQGGVLRGRELRCRVIALAGPDLRQRAAAGALRQDLYYRLDVLRVALPPLRERVEDIPLLLTELGGRHAGHPLEATPEAAQLLARHDWPGNVRELENEVRRLADLDLPRLPPGVLSPELRASAETPRPAAGGSLSELEREAVFAALRACGGNKARAAQQLGVSRSTLYRLLERYEQEG